MRIAIFHNLNSGGSLRALTYQARYLRRFGHRLTSFTLPTPHFTNPISYFTYIYHRLPHLHRCLAREIDIRSFAAVLVAPDHLTQSPYLLRYLTTPSVYYCPEPKRDLWETIGFETTTWPSRLSHTFHLPLKSIDRQSARHATTLLTNSRYSSQILASLYSHPVHVNYLGVDHGKFHPVTTPHRHHPHSFRPPSILSVGTFLPHKGFAFLIRALSLLPHPLRPHLALAGNGGSASYINHLHSLASNTGVKLEIIINPADNQLIHLYTSSDLFAAPFNHEPFGLVVLESLACGTPVVAVDEGGLPEIARTLHPHLFPPPLTLTPRSPIFFASAIKSILSLPQDKQHQLFENCTTLASHWSWEPSVRQLERFLLNASRYRVSHPSP